LASLPTPHTNNGTPTIIERRKRKLLIYTYSGIKGYTGYIFTGNLELAKKIGLKPKRRIEFFTSKIDCRLLEYELYAGTRDVKKMG
jgi:23S rRNA G2445 N2-methylase RlmL